MPSEIKFTNRNAIGRVTTETIIINKMIINAPLPKEIMDFITQYIDRDKLFNKALKKKIQMFYDSMKWDMPVDKKTSIERFF